MTDGGDKEDSTPSKSGVLAKIAGTLILVTVSIAFSLALAEIAIRMVAPQQLPNVRPDIWQPDDSVGWISRPDVNTTINTGERTVHVLTDSLGFRVGAGARPSGDSRILLLGDSFMQALQVEYEQSLAGLLERRLPARLGHPVVVEDAGVDGWDAPQYFIRAHSRAHPRRADAVPLATWLFVGRFRRLIPPPPE
jgi:hypothetical protein